MTTSRGHQHWAVMIPALVVMATPNHVNPSRMIVPTTAITMCFFMMMRCFKYALLHTHSQCSTNQSNDKQCCYGSAKLIQALSD